MEVYRITTKIWSNKLSGSGFPARWNSKGKFAIYSSSSRALASLENYVHRSGEGLNNIFKTMVIYVPDNLKIESINIKKLPNNWSDFNMYSECQSIGDQWLEKCETAILKVPSAIIKKEFNYIINPNHKSSKRIKIQSVEDFEFDLRMKN